ncbi:MAG: hypothetical protein QGG73_03320 [Candidatus Hydrogenedentes bacterium]|nr:hypothetical protein [Candidatus Hydrogenedentota bacterium]
MEATIQSAITVPGAENTFDRVWALSILEGAIDKLKSRYELKNQENVFEELRGTLSGGGELDSYEAIGGCLGKSPGAVKVAVHRLRLQFSEGFRQQVTETLADPTDAENEEELRHLLGSLDPSDVS